MTVIIEHHIRHLNMAIFDERTIRIHDILDIQKQLTYATKFVPSIYNLSNDLTNLHPMKLLFEVLNEQRNSWIQYIYSI